VVQIQLSSSIFSEVAIIYMVEMKINRLKKMYHRQRMSLRLVSGQDLGGMQMVMVAFLVQKLIMNVIMVSLN